MGFGVIKGTYKAGKAVATGGWKGLGFMGILSLERSCCSAALDGWER